jgi:hypothetical protein
VDRRAGRRADGRGRAPRVRCAAAVGAWARRRARVGARGLPARVRVVGAVFDRARRTGPADPDAPERRRARARVSAASRTRSTRSTSPAPRCGRAWSPSPPRSSTGPSWICGRWSITASGWSASASSADTACWRRCHASTQVTPEVPDRRRATNKGSQAQSGRQPQSESARRPVGTISSASDVTDDANRNSKPRSSSAATRGQLLAVAAAVRPSEQPATHAGEAPETSPSV